MEALFVIDMQKSVFEAPRYDSKGVINRVNDLAGVIRNRGGQVIFIHHNGPEEEGLLEGSDTWQLIDELIVKEGDIKMSKTACDSFYQTDLKVILDEKGVTDVVITGCVTEFCVDTTIRSTVSKNYNTAVISDGHTTGDRTHLDAKSIIEHHNWTWENLIIPDTHLQVIKAADYIAQTAPEKQT